MSHNPFNDRSTPIILRARDMRTEAYAEAHIEAIGLLLEHATLVGEGESLLRMASATLRRDLEAWNDALPFPSEEVFDAISWASEDAVAVIEDTTPEGWDYTSDPDDPSYGGFYPIDEEDDQ